MERKIGEIFEYNGEWHQCVESDGTCNGCVGTFQSYSFCSDFEECVGKIFKKLEKIGEPYPDYCPSGRVIYFQRYKCYQKPIYTGNFICWADDINISIEIKQTKEDMEEKKLNLKPFDIQKAREGKPVCTRDGRKARIICFDQKDIAPIVGLVTGLDGRESIYAFYKDGRVSSQKERVDDLMMLPEKKEGWVNVYKDSVYDTKDDALIGRSEIRGYIDTIKISWEE